MRLRLMFRLLVLLTVAAAGVTCSKSSTTGVDGATSDVMASTDVMASRDLGYRPDIPPDTALNPPPGVVFPDAPAMSCGGDAGDCQFPPSTCADLSCDGGICPGLAWVVYYDNPSCVAGQCVFTKRYFECGPISACSMGGCRFNGTAVVAP